MIRILILMTLCCAWFINGQAQNIYVHKTDGQTEVFQLIDVSRITLENNVMNLSLVTDDTLSWNFSQIDYYNYDQWYVSVPEGQTFSNDGVKVYPNPATESFVLQYELLMDSEIAISLMDMQGRVVRSFPTELQRPGIHQIEIRVSDMKLGKGAYVVRLLSGKSVFNKVVVING